MPINVRPMNKNDLEQLSEVYVAVYKKFDVGEKWSKKAAYWLLRYWLRKQPDLAFVTEHNGKIVGAFVAGIKPWWDGNHLFDGEIFVHPKYQKKGIGKLLTKVLFQKAIKKYNVTFWDAHTFKKKFPLRWYKSLGFKEIKEWTMITGNIRKALKKL